MLTYSLGLAEPLVECGQVHLKGKSDGPLEPRNKARQQGPDFAHCGGYCAFVQARHCADVH